MTSPIKQLLPEQWWRIAACVDAYEAACSDGFPDLRAFVAEMSGDERQAALLELVKVDLERRMLRGEVRKIEDYAADYPELSPVLVASSGTESASASAQIPDSPEQANVATVPFGVRPAPTHPLGGDRSGTLPTHFPLASASLPNETMPTTETSALDRAMPAAAGAGSGATIAGRGGEAAFDDDPSRAPQTLPVDTGATARSRASKASAAPTKASLGDARTLGESGAAGEMLGRYRISGTLGAGTFGVVYQCRDEELKRDVAIKVPRRGRGKGEQQAKQFLHEAQSAARLRHPGIVTVLDKGETEDGRAYIVYELVSGSSLQARMQGGEYTHRDAALWTAEIAEALQHAHQQGIVHRDIKPANVLLDERGKVKVADFGLAKMDDAFFTDDQGRVLGTVAYMSPEQAAGKSEWSSPQSDIYALGVVLYELLCRKLPFTKGSTDDILKQVIARPPAPPRTMDDTIPIELERICLRAMAKDPSARYTTAGDLAADLRAAVAPATPPRPPSRRAYWWGAAGAGALACALFVLMRPDDDRPPIPDTTPAEHARLARELAEQIKVVFDDPTVEIHLQRANETGTYQARLANDDLPLHEGDKVQVHVSLDRPQYVYLYWYDAAGTFRRLWPLDVAAQTKRSKVVAPDENDENQWLALDPTLGYEMVLLAVSDQEVDEQALTQFETRSAFAPPKDLSFERIAVIGSSQEQRRSRGLSGVVTSKKSPMNPDFALALEQEFDAYYGLAFPHK